MAIWVRSDRDPVAICERSKVRSRWHRKAIWLRSASNVVRSRCDPGGTICSGDPMVHERSGIDPSAIPRFCNRIALRSILDRLLVDPGSPSDRDRPRYRIDLRSILDRLLSNPNWSPCLVCFHLHQYPVIEIVRQRMNWSPRFVWEWRVWHAPGWTVDDLESFVLSHPRSPDLNGLLTDGTGAAAIGPAAAEAAATATAASAAVAAPSQGIKRIKPI